MSLVRLSYFFVVRAHCFFFQRFFVVDGGILVYARSPTDVARGRLHGSLDVGLSVISAKPRRRRIDIDADEFIYHLRAKTPDVFRTWLNVLKAHR